MIKLGWEEKTNRCKKIIQPKFGLFINQSLYSKLWCIAINFITAICAIIFVTATCFCVKVSEYPFKENKNTLKNIQVLLYTHFYNISLNVLRPNFLNVCNLPTSHFPNIKKIRVKVQYTISKLVELLQWKMYNTLFEKTRERFCAVVF